MSIVFSDNLKTLRQKSNYSQEKFAELIGYSSKNISKWETGKSLPNYETLKLIADVFSVSSVDSLLYNKSDYYEIDVIKDKEYIDKYNIQISKECIDFYYKLLNSNFCLTIEYNESLLDYLQELKVNNIINDYEICQSDDSCIIKCSTDKTASDKTIRSIINKTRLNRINFANDYEYKNYVESCKLSKQTKYVLDYIDRFCPEIFKLSELYSGVLLNTLEQNYGRNKDHKRIIRTSLSMLCEYRIITKEGYALYKKKHHKLDNSRLISKQDYAQIDKVTKFEFANDVYVRVFDLKDFIFLSEDEEVLLSLINQYMVYLRDLTLIYDYEIAIKNNMVNIKYYVEG